MKPYKYSMIETERTLLKILSLDYANDVFDLFSDQEVTKFMDIEPCKDVKEAEEIIKYHLEDSGCRWAIISKADNLFLGTCGFHYLRKMENGGTVGEIGYDLSRQYWGKGIMYEVMRSLVEYGFREMSLCKIDATVEPDNERSIKLLDRLRFTKEDELVDNFYYYHLETCKGNN